MAAASTGSESESDVPTCPLYLSAGNASQPTRPQFSLEEIALKRDKNHFTELQSLKRQHQDRHSQPEAPREAMQLKLGVGDFSDLQEVPLDSYRLQLGDALKSDFLLGCLRNPKSAEFLFFALSRGKDQPAGGIPLALLLRFYFCNLVQLDDFVVVLRAAVSLLPTEAVADAVLELFPFPFEDKTVNVTEGLSATLRLLQVSDRRVCGSVAEQLVTRVAGNAPVDAKLREFMRTRNHCFLYLCQVLQFTSAEYKAKVSRALEGVHSSINDFEVDSLSLAKGFLFSITSQSMRVRIETGTEERFRKTFLK